MEEYKRRNARELYASLCRSYELLCEYGDDKYVEYNVAESAKSDLRGIMQDLDRDFPGCSLHIEHDCNYHGYNDDNRCAVCGEIIDYEIDAEEFIKLQSGGDS